MFSSIEGHCNPSSPTSRSTMRAITGDSREWQSTSSAALGPIASFTAAIRAIPAVSRR